MSTQAHVHTYTEKEREREREREKERERERNLSSILRLCAIFAGDWNGGASHPGPKTEYAKFRDNGTALPDGPTTVWTAGSQVANKTTEVWGILSSSVLCVIG